MIWLRSWATCWKFPWGVSCCAGASGKVDKRYGSQFVAATWEETMPATVYGIEKYLGSGLVKGIGPRFARAIVQRFGAATIEVIETDIERLYEVPQIGRKRVEKIRESWERQKEIKNVMLFLQSYGVSTAYAAKIYREYGSESIDKVRENPYRLADDIWGIGFKTADGIAGKMGYGRTMPAGAGAGFYTRSANSRTRDTSMPNGNNSCKRPARCSKPTRHPSAKRWSG